MTLPTRSDVPAALGHLPTDATAPADPAGACAVCGGAPGTGAAARSLVGVALLCDEHAKAATAHLQAWLDSGPARRAASAAQQARRLRRGETLDRVRDWARAEGLPVAASGSLSQQVVQAYRRAHASSPDAVA